MDGQGLIPNSMHLQQFNFQGLNISIFSENELDDYIDSVLTSENSTVGYGYSLGIIPKMHKTPELLKITNKFDLLVTDGRLFYLFSKLFGAPLNFDISIPNLVFKSLIIAEKKNASVFFLGGSESANSKTLINVKAKYPKLRTVTGYHGFWQEGEIGFVINLLKEKSPDIIFLTLTTPQKEILAAQLKSLSIGKFIIPCGGMIDILAGDKKVSPKIIKKLGLAWFFRFIQEPNVRYKLLLTSAWALIQVTFLIIFDKLFIKKNDSFLKYLHKV